MPKNLLEVGAGDGAILSDLSAQKFCPSLHALDISNSGVEVIKHQNIEGLEECKIFDGYNLDYPDKHFDLVILSHVLEHVEYERALLREIIRVGKHHVIEVPLDMNSIINNGCGTSLLPSYGHINVYNPDTLKFLLRSEGFYIIDDLLGKTNFEAISYQYFEMRGIEKTMKALETLRKSTGKQENIFSTLERNQQEHESHFYAVLTRESARHDKRVIHIMHIMQLIRNEKKEEALMIINAFYDGQGKKSIAESLEKLCLHEKRQDAAHFFHKVAN